MKARFAPRFAVLASGSGSNFLALAQRFPQQIAGLICNVSGAFVLQRAASVHIPSVVVPHSQFKDRPAHERAVVAALQQLDKNLSLVVLAGYMRVLSPVFFQEFQKHLPGVRLINLHPAHLSEYKGAKGYEAAVARQAPRWGLSVHEVIPELDAGPLLASAEIPVPPFFSASELQQFALPFEHALLADTVATLLEQLEYEQFEYEQFL